VRKRRKARRARKKGKNTKPQTKNVKNDVATTTATRNLPQPLAQTKIRSQTLSLLNSHTQRENEVVIVVKNQNLTARTDEDKKRLQERKNELKRELEQKKKELEKMKAAQQLREKK